MKLQSFQAICLEQCQLKPELPVLAAFSGGADSLSLIICLKNAGFQVIAAHFNHHLREAAEQDEKAAARSAGILGIPFIAGGGDVPALVREQKLSVEEAARQSRYLWLLSQAEINQAQAVAVGHTADDQVETVLMHLLRGTGLDGLTGMSFHQTFPLWNSRIPVVRPLLDTWREETEAICREAGLTPVQDETNQSTRYFRNRIRLELIPYLQGYNPQAKTHLLQTSRILAEEQTLLESVIEEAWQSCFNSRSDDWISFNVTGLESLPEGLRRTVLRRGLLELEPAVRDIDYAITGRLSDFASQSSHSGEMHLFKNLWINKTTGRITIWKGRPGLTDFYPQIETGKEYPLNLSGNLAFSGWKMNVCEVDMANSRRTAQDGRFETQVWMDADKLQIPLTVRTGQPGERLSPLGMGGKTQKLSDFWINRKIPRQARAGWPLVVSGQAIVWVVGVGISESAAITPETRRVVRISLQFPDHRQDG